MDNIGFIAEPLVSWVLDPGGWKWHVSTSVHFKKLFSFPFIALLGGHCFPAKLADSSAMDQFKAAVKTQAQYSSLVYERRVTMSEQDRGQLLA